MQQLRLLSSPESATRTLVDDESGRIVYAPNLATGQQRADWFAALLAGAQWHSESRPMYDRVVDVPRLTAYFALDAELPPAVAGARALVETRFGLAFNSVGLNLYRDGRDSVAMHNDHTERLVPRSPIALLSLGDVRIMRIQTKARPWQVLTIALEPGSVLLMAGASQECWEHGVPKTREPVGPRISLAFRQRLHP